MTICTLKAPENPSVLLLACGGGRGFQVLLRFPCITCCLPSLSQGHPASSEDTSSMKLWAQPAPVWHHLDQPMPFAGTLLANKVLGVKTSSCLWGFPFNVLKTIVSPIRSSERSDLFFLPSLWYVVYDTITGSLAMENPASWPGIWWRYGNSAAI